jgi:hypothetical protein
MAVYLDRLAIAAPPKTGSSWAAAVLQSQFGAMTIRNVHYLPEAEFPVVATIIRHPRTWLPSLFRYMTAKQWRPMPAPSHFGILAGLRAETFEGFVRNVSHMQGCVLSMFLPYLDAATVVLHQETLQADMQRLLGKPISRELCNVTACSVAAEWTDTLWDLIAASEKTMIRLATAPAGL